MALKAYVDQGDLEQQLHALKARMVFSEDEIAIHLARYAEAKVRRVLGDALRECAQQIRDLGGTPKYMD